MTAIYACLGVSLVAGFVLLALWLSAADACKRSRDDRRKLQLELEELRRESDDGDENEEAEEPDDDPPPPPGWSRTSMPVAIGLEKDRVLISMQGHFALRMSAGQARAHAERVLSMADLLSPPPSDDGKGAES